MNYRMVNRLWWETVESLTKEDLNLLKEAFRSWINSFRG
jgi:hypothetical protein